MINIVFKVNKLDLILGFKVKRFFWIGFIVEFDFDVFFKVEFLYVLINKKDISKFVKWGLFGSIFICDIFVFLVDW